jgi:hypothetical protein
MVAAVVHGTNSMDFEHIERAREGEMGREKFFFFSGQS